MQRQERQGQRFLGRMGRVRNAEGKQCKVISAPFCSVCSLLVCSPGLCTAARHTCENTRAQISAGKGWPGAEQREGEEGMPVIALYAGAPKCWQKVPALQTCRTHKIPREKSTSAASFYTTCWAILMWCDPKVGRVKFGGFNKTRLNSSAKLPLMHQFLGMYISMNTQSVPKFSFKSPSFLWDTKLKHVWPR